MMMADSSMNDAFSVQYSGNRHQNATSATPAPTSQGRQPSPVTFAASLRMGVSLGAFLADQHEVGGGQQQRQHRQQEGGGRGQAVLREFEVVAEDQQRQDLRGCAGPAARQREQQVELPHRFHRHHNQHEQRRVLQMRQRDVPKARQRTRAIHA
ncbi:hypothetical protein G6F65_021347 [Rhizopus arrhizus]|nr:hypothetical protein G6F65_021347 [Rhizopus arrhizus]